MKFHRLWLAPLALAALVVCKRPTVRPDSRRAPGAMFNSDVSHPWNVVHHALFDRTLDVGVPPCSQRGSCDQVDPKDILNIQAVSKKVLVGGDQPSAFIAEHVYFLEEPARNAAALKAIDDALQVSPESDVLSAALLQNDIWERHDAVFHALESGQFKDKPLLERLLPKLKALVRHLALPKATLRGLKPNLPEFEVGFPEFAGINQREGWLEVRHERDTGTGLTVHSERWGYRFYFRVLIRKSPMEFSFRPKLETRMRMPAGTQMVILGAPMAISKERELVPLDVYTVVEQRVAIDEQTVLTQVNQARSDVFEATRAHLTSIPRRNGGFERLETSALVPFGGTCQPNRFSQTVVKAACFACHGIDGSHLTAPFGDRNPSPVEEPNPTAAAERVRKAKLKEHDFQRLIET